MKTISGSVAAIRASSANDLKSVLDIDLEKFLDTQSLRFTIYQSYCINSKGLFHRRKSVELLKDGLGIETILYFNDDSCAVLTIGQIYHI